MYWSQQFYQLIPCPVRNAAEVGQFAFYLLSFWVTLDFPAGDTVVLYYFQRLYL